MFCGHRAHLIVEEEIRAEGQRQVLIKKFFHPIGMRILILTPATRSRKGTHSLPLCPKKRTARHTNCTSQKSMHSATTRPHDAQLPSLIRGNKNLASAGLSYRQLQLAQGRLVRQTSSTTVLSSAIANDCCLASGRRCHSLFSAQYAVCGTAPHYHSTLC